MSGPLTLVVTERGLCEIAEQITSIGKVVGWEGGLIAVKWPGRHYYASQGAQFHYAEGSYTVYRMATPARPGFEEWPVRAVVFEVLDWPLRTNGPVLPRWWSDREEES